MTDNEKLLLDIVKNSYNWIAYSHQPDTKRAVIALEKRGLIETNLGMMRITQAGLLSEIGELPKENKNK